MDKRKARLLPCYLKATKGSKLGHGKLMYDLRNEMGMPETEEQQLSTTCMPQKKLIYFSNVSPTHKVFCLPWEGKFIKK